MPTASSTLKSRIIGTFERRRAMNASTLVIAATRIGGPMLAAARASGWRSRPVRTSSSMRLWTWIARSMPNPIRIGRPEIVTSDRSIPIQPSAEKVHTTPTITASSGSRRRRTRNITTSTTTITARAITPSRAMPPLR